MYLGNNLGCLRQPKICLNWENRCRQKKIANVDIQIIIHIVLWQMFPAVSNTDEST